MEQLSDTPFKGRLLPISTNIGPGSERLAREEHSSLLSLFIKDEDKGSI
jgi:hypothetical protein